MNERVKILLRIVMAVLFLIPANYATDYGLAFFMAAYLIAGYDVILEAVKGVFYGEIFDEHSLMSIATAGALILGEYNEACAVMILYQLGELFSDYASDRSRENIIALMDLRPDYANIECHNGTTKRVSPSDVEEGSVIVIRPGEKIPIDSVILEGHSAIDTSALTGESIPRDVMAGDEILSGCVNISGALRAKTLKAFTDSAASKILQLIENSSANKSRAGKFIERFAAVYTPAVCVAALCLAVIPPMIYGNFSAWAYRALTFLVVSCPCALVVSVPLAFFAAVGGAGRRGILIKGEIFIERLAEASCVIFDKTGTLTRGVFDVAAVHPEGITENEFLHIAAHAERYSAHPAGLALKRAYPNESDSCVVGEVEEIAGRGVRANVNGKIICAGNDKLMESAGASWHPCEKSGTIIHVSDNGKYIGHAVISDTLKPNAHEAVNALKSEGISRIVMFTGDNESTAREVAQAAGIDEYHSSMLPDDKVNMAESLAGVKIFVGDGINDAPLLACADVGIAMGGLGSDAAVEAADVVLMDDDPMKVPETVRISRRCMRIVRQNVYGSIGVKVLCLALGAIGLAGMRVAVFADVGVMVLAVVNAIRAGLGSVNVSRSAG